MRCLLIYQLRLGDIIACFPIAKFLNDQGHSVTFCCREEYHSIFKTISYCKPVSSLKNKKEYDQIFDLQIHRHEYDRYRESQLPWRDYVYGKYPELIAAKDQLPVFDQIGSVSKYQLPERFALAAPFGISQTTRINFDWFFETFRSFTKYPIYVLTPPGKNISSRYGQKLQAQSLADLPGLIQAASTFMTINSAPNIIASGVRSSYYHVEEFGFNGQNNLYFPNQIRLQQPTHLNRSSWRHLVNQARYGVFKWFGK